MGIWDDIVGGFTPVNRQGAQPPLGFSETIANNRNALVGLGMGLMGGTREDPYGQAMRGYLAGSENDQTALYRQAQLKRAAAADAYQRERDKIADAFKERALSRETTTNDIREYQFALTPAGGNFKGSFNDWMTRGKGAADKPPAGYDWGPTNPETGQRTQLAIEGGPATKLPVETAGRLGLMQAAKPGLEEAKKYFLDEKKNILTDDAGTGGALPGMAKQAIGQATGSFEIGRQRRNVRIAIEAALRTATGAAAPEQEVSRYTEMYAPSIYDDIKTRKQKIGALERFMENAESVITRGHVAPKSTGKSDPWGIR